MIEDSELPNLPYADPEGAVITAMHGGLWCSFNYRVGSNANANATSKTASGAPISSYYDWDAANGSATFKFSEGGQQCNRPEGGHGQILVEGVLEELDEASEFHFNVRTKVLTLWHNATSGTPPPPSSSLLEVAELKVLVNITGSQATPVRDVHFVNVGFRDTAPSIFAPHVAPTGGDWAVNRHAALTASGTVNLQVTGSTFWRLDNAGIFLGGFQRGTVVADNEFAWLGESGIVSVGDTEGAGFEAYPGFGWDGTTGNQPRGTMILRNFAHELGIFNKQSAMYFQAATSNTTMEGNVGFNGARSGVNFNDAFGTGSTMTGSVLFNLNRETADHGCFNSWDRLPFVPGKGPQNRDVLYRNLALSNFNSYNGLDTDDDSAYYLMKANVLHYGHVLKSDFSGHSIEYAGNLGVFTRESNQYQPVPSGYRNTLHDTTIYSEIDTESIFSLTKSTCNGTTDDFPIIYNIKVFSPSGNGTLCHKPYSFWEANGKLKNVTAAQLPTDPATIIAAARATLGLTK